MGRKRDEPVEVPLTETEQTIKEVLECFLSYTDALEPAHEWLQGEVAYFQRMGFSMSLSRHMAAIEYMSAFGIPVEDEEDEGQEEDDDE